MDRWRPKAGRSLMGVWGSDRWAPPGAEERRGAAPALALASHLLGIDPAVSTLSSQFHPAYRTGPCGPGGGVSHLSNVLPNHCLLFQTSAEGPGVQLTFLHGSQVRAGHTLLGD